MELKQENQQEGGNNKESHNMLETQTVPLLEKGHEEKNTKKRVDKNALFILFGLILGVIISGSFGLDLFKQQREKAPGERTDIFEENGKTWVAYDMPIINVEVVSDKNCIACEYEDTIKFLKMNLTPTLKINKVELDSEEGKNLIDNFGIKFIPAFVFESNIENVENFNEARQVFGSKKDGKYYLDLTRVSLPSGKSFGKYLGDLKIEDSDAYMGSKDAKVTIIEFSDFQCPYCKIAEETISKVVENYKDKIRLVYKHFPIQGHKNAEKAAEAAECAKDQEKFWEMHDLMFENQSKLEIADLKKYALDLNLNSSEFDNCLDSGKYTGKVQNDMDAGISYGVSGTPAFFINGQFLNGAQPVEKFREIIDAELAR